MSFENMKEMSQVQHHERSCMMMYYFTMQEARQIMNVARMIGIKDCITLKPSHGNNKVREILDNTLTESEDMAIKEKTIIFNGIPSARMNLFIDTLKKCRIKRPIIAVVTEQTIDWTLNELLINLANERSALNRGEFTAHDAE
ncbi:MAG: DUF3783 domain-containing protein [Cellulosilyticum sp.]|nr:DUF3783 domain-containing protein [Cellulosilyticum sp.]